MILLWSRGVVAFWGGTGKTSADLVEGKRREVNGMKNWCYPVTKKKENRGWELVEVGATCRSDRECVDWEKERRGRDGR